MSDRDDMPRRWASRMAEHREAHLPVLQVFNFRKPCDDIDLTPWQVIRGLVAWAALRTSDIALAAAEYCLRCQCPRLGLVFVGVSERCGHLARRMLG